jgi:hypothetical protein
MVRKLFHLTISLLRWQLERQLEGFKTGTKAMIVPESLTGRVLELGLKTREMMEWLRI